MEGAYVIWGFLRVFNGMDTHAERARECKQSDEETFAVMLKRSWTWDSMVVCSYWQICFDFRVVDRLKESC